MRENLAIGLIYLGVVFHTGQKDIHLHGLAQVASCGAEDVVQVL